MGFAWWLCGLEFELAPPKEIALVGDDAQSLLEVVFGAYRPNQVVVWKKDEKESVIPLVEGREAIRARATADAGDGGGGAKGTIGGLRVGRRVPKRLELSNSDRGVYGGVLVRAR